MESIKATREEVKRFLFIQNSNYGLDYGGNKGSDDGYGFGFGSGKGSDGGYGFGYGSSVGSGFGSERSNDGSGFGSEYGFSPGPDFGFGYGNGDVIALNGNIVDYIDNVPTIIIQVHGNIACGYIVKEDLTLESCFIAKVGNSFAHGKTLKDAVADAKAKETKRLPIEERIEKFIEIFGPLDSEHTGKEFYDWHHVLTGSCKMGRDAFCKTHNIGLTKMYSVRYFLNITEETYGGNVIKSIKEKYEKIEK